LVNVIAPIMTETGGPAWRQTIFWPFAQMSRYGRGTVLKAKVQSETYATRYYDPRGAQDLYFAVPEVPYLKVSAVADHEGGLTLFLLNRDLKDGVEVTIDARNFGALKVREAEELQDNDLKAINTKSDPLRVKPRPINDISVSGGKITVSLKAASWNVIKLAG
jgi:alpha-N-arabinofuranosidase